MYNDPNCIAWIFRTRQVPERYASRYDLVQQTKGVEESKSEFAHVTRVEQAGNGVDDKKGY
jgi:hypothetical protein